MKLTKRFIDGLAAAERERIEWDSELRGFGVRVQPSGIKSFVVQFRTVAGVSRRMSLGRVGVLTVDEARKAAREILVAVAKGGDPAEDKAAKRAAPTVNDLLDRYLSDHARCHNAPRTVAGVEDMVDRILRPALGSKKVADVTREAVDRLHKSMATTPRSANHCLAVLSKAMSLAEVWRMRPDGSNPCRHVVRFRENSRERYLSDEELVRLGHTLALARTTGLPWIVDETSPRAKYVAKKRTTTIDPQILDLVELLALSACRISELVELCWAEVDLNGGTLALPSVKGGARRLYPVSVAAVELLSAMESRTESAWVFPAKRDRTRPMALGRVEVAWARIRRHAGLADCRLHDLRHTAATYASMSGANAFGVRDFLRHRTMSMAGRYVSRVDSPVRAIAESVGAKVSEGLRRGGRSAAIEPPVEP